MGAERRKKTLLLRNGDLSAMVFTETWSLEPFLHYLRHATEQVSYQNLNFPNSYVVSIIFSFLFFLPSLFIPFLLLGTSERNLEPRNLCLILDIQHNSLTLFSWYILKITYTQRWRYIYMISNMIWYIYDIWYDIFGMIYITKVYSKWLQTLFESQMGYILHMN